MSHNERMKIIEITEVQVGDTQVSQFTAESPRHESTVIAADETTITLRIEIARRNAYQARQYRNQTYKRTSPLAKSASHRWYERA